MATGVIRAGTLVGFFDGVHASEAVVDQQVNLKTILDYMVGYNHGYRFDDGDPNVTNAQRMQIQRDGKYFIMPEFDLNLKLTDTVKNYMFFINEPSSIYGETANCKFVDSYCNVKVHHTQNNQEVTTTWVSVPAGVCVMACRDIQVGEELLAVYNILEDPDDYEVGDSCDFPNADSLLRDLSNNMVYGVRVPDLVLNNNSTNLWFPRAIIEMDGNDNIVRRTGLYHLLRTEQVVPPVQGWSLSLRGQLPDSWVQRYNSFERLNAEGRWQQTQGTEDDPIVL